MQLFYPPEEISVAGAEHIDFKYAGIYEIVLNCGVESGIGAAQLAAYLTQLTCQYCKLSDP